MQSQFSHGIDQGYVGNCSAVSTSEWLL
jgi:hypothetical protein